MWVPLWIQQLWIVATITYAREKSHFLSPESNNLTQSYGFKWNYIDINWKYCDCNRVMVPHHGVGYPRICPPMWNHQVLLHHGLSMHGSPWGFHIIGDPQILHQYAVADPRGPRRPAPPAPVKTSQKKRWPLPRTASFASHQALLLGQISGSATGVVSDFKRSCRNIAYLVDKLGNHRILC